MKKKPTISIIVAAAQNRAIGRNNKLLWHIPEDLKRFRKLTLGHPVIMGQKTFESIGRPLPKRTNIVLSKNRYFLAHGCIVCHSFNQAVKIAKQKDNQEIFIIGGGEVYRQAIGIADKLYLTLVQGSYEADTFFPDYSQFQKVIRQRKGKAKDISYTFLELERSSEE